MKEVVWVVMTRQGEAAYDADVQELQLSKSIIVFTQKLFGARAYVI